MKLSGRFYKMGVLSALAIAVIVWVGVKLAQGWREEKNEVTTREQPEKDATDYARQEAAVESARLKLKAVVERFFLVSMPRHVVYLSSSETDEVERLFASLQKPGQAGRLETLLGPELTEADKSVLRGMAAQDGTVAAAELQRLAVKMDEFIRWERTQIANAIIGRDEYSKAKQEYETQWLLLKSFKEARRGE